MANFRPSRAAPPPPPLRKGSVQAFEAIETYQSKKAGELSFDEGDILYVVDQSDAEWWTARRDRQQGRVPAKYVSRANLRCVIVEAARRGADRLLAECIDNGISVHALDRTGAAALHAASHGGHEACVRRLLDEEKVQVDLQNKAGDTALHVAASRGHARVCEMLLAGGADAGVANRCGQTPRQLCVDPLVSALLAPPPSAPRRLMGGGDEADSDSDTEQQ